MEVKFLRQLKHAFIPHEGNNFKPHALQKTAVVGMMGLVFLSFTIANLQSLLWVTSEWMVSTILPAVIIADTNEERADEELTPLVRNSLLDQAAQKKAEDMAKYEYFSHDSPEGITPWYWFDDVGYNYLHAGENLAVHFTDSSEVVEAWMKSPTHRANIMNDDYQEIGIGTAKGEYEGFPTVYVVQLFGTRQARAATPEPVVVPTPEPEPAVVAEVEPVPEPEAIIEPEPVTAVAATPEPVEVVAEEPELATSTPSTSPAFAVAGSETRVEEETATSDATVTEETAELVVEDQGAIYYTSYVSTSTAGVPASLDELNSPSGSTPPELAFVTQPQLVLQALYVVLGTFVAVTLLLSIVVEIRRQEPVQIAYGMALIAIMILLFDFHISLTSGILIT